MTKYTVQSGDTLGKIAQKFLGNSSKYMEIANANNLSNPNAIHVGQVLEIPGTEPLPSTETAVAAPVFEASSESVSEGVKLTASILFEIMKGAREANIERYLNALNNVLPQQNINTPMRVAQFLAQIGHESGSLNFDIENLNYSQAALQAVFGKYFPTAQLAADYARQPEKIANRVYANRMGNGDEASGDGWKYRGRGLIQLTGKDNYSAFSSATGIDVVSNPNPLANDPELAVKAATWFWTMRGLNTYADQDDIRTITKRINGGYNGLEDREAYLARAKSALGLR